MAAPISSHLISGKVRDRLGDLLSGATVTLTHSSIEPVLTETTNAAGEYIINLSGLSSQWSVGDSISVKATKATKGTITVGTVILAGASQTVNLTLAETSDLVFGENSQDRYNLNFALLTTYDGEKVTSINPLPVSSSEIDFLNNPEQTNTYDSKNRLSTETITLANGDVYKRTFTYTGNAFQFTTRGRWIKE